MTTMKNLFQLTKKVSMKTWTRMMIIQMTWTMKKLKKENVAVNVEDANNYTTVTTKNATAEDDNDDATVSQEDNESQKLGSKTIYKNDEGNNNTNNSSEATTSPISHIVCTSKSVETTSTNEKMATTFDSQTSTIGNSVRTHDSSSALSVAPIQPRRYAKKKNVSETKKIIIKIKEL